MRDRLDNLNAILGGESLVVVKESKRPLPLYNKETLSKSKRLSYSENLAYNKILVI